MTELERSIAAYAMFLDEQSLSRSPVHIRQSQPDAYPDEGDPTVVEIRTPEADRLPEEAEEHTRRGWLGYGMLAAAAVVVVIGAILLTDEAEESSPVDAVAVSDEAFTETDALATVEAYYAAFDAGDAAAIEAAFVENPPGRAFDLGNHVGNLIWDAAQGTDVLDRTCTARAGEGEPTAIVVICEYGLHDSVHQAVDAPATPITARITVTAEGIQFLSTSEGEPDFRADNSFDSWMSANHAEDADAARCCGGGRGESIDGERANGELRQQYAEQWAAYLSEHGCTYETVGCASGEEWPESDAFGTVEAAYMAFEAGDTDGLEALFVEDPSGGAFDIDGHVRFSAWNAGQGSTMTDPACTETVADPPRFVVVCQYESHQAVQQVAGAPGTVVTETITVTTEGIQTVDASWAAPAFVGDDAFGAWMLANHREDADAIEWDEGVSIDDARSTGALRRQYAEEWAAYLEDSGCTYDQIGC